MNNIIIFVSIILSLIGVLRSRDALSILLYTLSLSIQISITSVFLNMSFAGLMLLMIHAGGMLVVCVFMITSIPLKTKLGRLHWTYMLILIPALYLSFSEIIAGQGIALYDLGLKLYNDGWLIVILMGLLLLGVMVGSIHILPLKPLIEKQQELRQQWKRDPHQSVQLTEIEP